MSELYEKSLSKLELDGVLDLLAAQAVSDAAKEACRNLKPETDAEEVRRLQEQTTAACKLISLKGSPSLGGIRDVGASLDRARRGGSLTPGELLKIASSLRVARTVKAYADLQKAVNDGVAPSGLQIVDCRTLFGNGQIGFHVDAPSQASNWTDINMEVAIIDTYSSDHHLAMFANTEHPEECALFIEYLTGPEGMALYNESTFVIPARKSVESIDAYKNLDPIQAQFLKGAATARSLPVGSATFVAAMEDIANGIQRIVINGEDPATVVAEVAAKLEERY